MHHARFCVLLSCANGPPCYLLLQHKLGNSCLWSDVQIGDVLSTSDGQLLCLAAMVAKRSTVP